MHELFADYVSRMPALFKALEMSAEVPLSAAFPKAPAIYVFVDNSVVARIGRTNNLKRRIQSHCRQDHNSASYAFKLARLELGLKRTYQKVGSRADLQTRPDFAEAFARHILRLRAMNVRYLIVEDPVEQYLLELYASMKYELSLDEFDNH